MPKENIELSKDGLKTSLLTFISGPAISLIVIGFLVIAYYFPVFNEPLKAYKHFGLSLENKIFIGILLYLLLHPFGLIIDTLGWMLLGWMEKGFETYHFNHRTFLTRGTKNYLCFETLKKTLGLNSDNFYEQARQAEYVLFTKHADLIGELDFSLGSSILFRNLTLCSCTLVLAYWLMGHFLTGLLVLIGPAVFIIINSCVSFYYSLSLLMFYSKIRNIIVGD
jgi:hypothetical protein